MAHYDWFTILTRCGVRPDTARNWAPVFDAEIGPDTFSTGAEEIPEFLGQILHESGRLERIEEGLSYSVERMMAVWPARFPTHAGARPYERNPQALANKVYGGRMGNTEPGDGFKFRGRGLLAVTGRDNYRAVGKAIGLDLETNPDLLADPAIALRASIAWWNANIPDGMLGDITKVTRRVNGGTHGIDDRVALTKRASEALG